MKRSKQLFFEAQKHITGGVNSPVRSFKGVGGIPIFFKQGKGQYLYDEDDNKYIDYVCAWGPLILGHAYCEVTRLIQETTINGLSFGAPSEIETKLASKIKQLMPSIELIRMCNSGTEATMSAIRLARGFTNRDKIVKFRGCYHGHSDSLLSSVSSEVLSLEEQSLGIPLAIAKNTISLDYNNITQVNELFSKIGELIAAVIVEPIAGNMGCILPVPGFLERLRELCTQYKCILIFDEVMTGFRVASGGAQQIYKITPDITTLGKIIGGGMPIGALGGRREIMEMLAPIGSVYQAGTLSGHPLSMVAGLATLEAISTPDFYSSLQEKTNILCEAIKDLGQRLSIPLVVNQTCGMFSIFFTQQILINSYSQVLTCNQNIFKEFFHGMLAEGLYFPPSSLESCFISSAHSLSDINITINAIKKVFSVLFKCFYSKNKE